MRHITLKMLNIGQVAKKGWKRKEGKMHLAVLSFCSYHVLHCNIMELPIESYELSMNCVKNHQLMLQKLSDNEIEHWLFRLSLV